MNNASDWINLFDGKTLKGWAALGDDAGWKVEDGCILCTVQGGQYLYTLDQFDDFVLEIDYKIEPNCNSGIFLRWRNLSDPVQTGIEIQVLDTHGKEPATVHCCGAIYDLVPPTRNVCSEAGGWNHHAITCNDNMLTVELNGEEIAVMDLDLWDTPEQNHDGTKNKFKTALKDFARYGHIGLQDHGGKVWYRNIRVKKL
ncbi:MAG: DUF1080 domain-containing protein [Planctomycetota bacterium]|nr:DUF1080 domain-containing protein [Planctomycetota bacterium]MDA1140063.1 DUF1080 domain-containing protein [Planctomycetota bacterium]